MAAFFPRSSIAWLRRGGTWGQALRGMAVGLPFPICSCGVVPLYRSLVRKGAPPAAGLAFLVATPELGLDAVLLSIPLLGGEMTLARVIGAALVALLVGGIVGRFSAKAAAEQPDTEAVATSGGFWERLRGGMKDSFGEGMDHTAPWIILGLVIAALAGPFLSELSLDAVPAVWEVPLFALVGLPMYVCASGATPLVAVLLLHGVSPGAALAFLLTGPATNVTTFGVLSQLHGRRLALAFSLVMMALSIAAGFVTNLCLSSGGAVAGSEHSHESAGWLGWGCLIVLALAYTASLLRRGPRRFVGEILGH